MTSNDVQSSPALSNPAATAVRLTLGGCIALFVFGIVVALLADWKAKPPVPDLEVAKCMTAIFSLAASVVGLVFVAVFDSQRRRINRDFADYRAGQYLAHWTYPPEEWEAFVQAEYQRLRESARSKLRAFPWVALIVSGLIAFSMTGWHAKVWGFIWTFGVMCVIGVIFGLVLVFRVANRVRQLRKDGGQVYIGRNSAYCAGDAQFWNTAMRRLIEVDVAPGSPTIVTLTVQWSMGKLGTLAQAGNIAAGRYSTSTQRIMYLCLPIPAGEGGAESVISALNEETKPARSAPLG